MLPTRERPLAPSLPETSVHPTSLENMHKCYRRYVKGGPLDQQERITVLDIGGADVNGSFRQVFNDPKFHYLTCDLADAPGVSIVLEDPYRLPLDDASVDLVLSGQMLEHCEFFWLAFAEMVRVVKPSGYVFLIAPSAGPIHRHPVDCYRFYPDAFRALAKYANCKLVDLWQDERPPWNDLVGVFARHAVPSRSAAAASESAFSEPQHPSDQRGTEAEEAVQGDRTGIKVLADIHAALKPRSYLEIGVETGASLALAACPAVGVDPEPQISVELPASAKVVAMASDDYFDAASGQKPAEPPDLVFIDGMHLFEYALRDFMNAERICAPHSLIVIDDIYPNHPAQAERGRRTRLWAGDVWKLIRYLRKFRPDLYLQTIDSAPTGLLMVAGLNPDDRTLWENYNAIVVASRKLAEPSPDILKRSGALPGRDPRLAVILERLAKARGETPVPGALAEDLRRLTAGAPAAE